MAPLPLPHLLLPVLVLLAVAVADALPPSCTEAITCGDHVVRYPFSLINSWTPHCGYPGLGLICEDNDTLTLPVQSHRYRVISVDYQARTVRVSDPDVDGYALGCPRLRMNITIDTTISWLQLAPSDSNITLLYNCKKNISLSSAVELAECRQDGKRSYLLPDGWITGAEAYDYECEEVVVAPVSDVHRDAVVSAPTPRNGSFDEVLQGGFELKYNFHSQQCHGCERSGGWCGYQPYQSNQTNGGTVFICFCDGGPTDDRCGTYASSSPESLLFGDFLLLGLQRVEC
jgi:hypothetical protein